MKRLKLPGSTKTKKIILVILAVLSMAVLIFEGIKFKTAKHHPDDEIPPAEQTQTEDTKELPESELNPAPKEEDKKDENSKDKKVKSSAPEITQEENNLCNTAKDTFFNGNYQEAIKQCNEILKKYPKCYMALNIRGIASAYNGSFENGMADIDKSLQIYPDYGYARFNKALTYELYEKFDEALVWYDKALEIEDYVWTYYGIASIYGRRGDVSNTVSYLKKAVEIDPAVKAEAAKEKDFNPVKNTQEFKDVIK